MALMNVQLKDLTSAVRRTGQHAFDAGNHADIWLGEYIDPKHRTRQVAIKVIRSAFTAEEVKQFNEKLLREARLWTTLDHDNIVPFLGIMTTSDMSRHSAPALVSPYYKNGSLTKYVTSNSLTLREKMNLLYQIANGMAFLHGHHVVHGDIKPGNILVSDGGQVVLTDFGLSIVLEMSGFTTKNTPGTLRYMAPELLAEPTSSAAIRPTKETDAWAFGITATEIFSTKQPYHNLPKDAAVLIYVTKRQGRLKYDDYKHDIKEGLWSLLENCWKQNPGERPSMSNIKGFVDKKRSSYS
ncbi:kinase-like domain-containing protein [Butyriboletus roseoflavus]|nr:kinase-like domain-containing protein [Butyriboletus roseoflavus]